MFGQTTTPSASLHFSPTAPGIHALEEVESVIQDTEIFSLVVFNDDFNTFDHVIDTLIEVCKHTQEQAEQCTILIHHKGKCTVKNGDFETLAPMCTSICQRGISAEVL